jgi:plastocyanin
MKVRSTRLTSRIAALALIGAMVVPAMPAHAAQTWTVQVGASNLQTLTVANVFGPSSIAINVGDTVTWAFDATAPHTVTFPGSEAPPSPDAPAPGQRPGEVNALPPALLPAGPTGPNAQYDGVGRASSGFPTGPESASYSLTFTRAGAFMYVCELHPGMSGSVIVQPAGAALAETVDQAKARGQAELGMTVGRANALSARVATERIATSNTGAVNAVLAGFSGGDASVFRFLPDAVTVNRGDTIEWTLADPQEIHTITFFTGQAPPDPTDIRPNPQGPPTVVFKADAARPRGGSVYAGTGYVNSGILGYVTGDYAWAVKIDAPAGTYNYVCLIHPFMAGTIRVAGGA